MLGWLALYVSWSTRALLPTRQVDPVDEGPGSHARESIWTTPNMITMTRIACSPVLSWFILQDEYEKALAGVGASCHRWWVHV